MNGTQAERRERYMRALAESRVPGSTAPGGMYDSDDSWRAALARDAEAVMAEFAPPEVDAPDECLADICYCSRWVDRNVRAALEALEARGWRRPPSGQGGAL